MHNLVRTAALQLQSLDNKEVVKIAGVLNRLKNVFKRLVNKDYATAVDQLREDSAMINSVADQLKNRINDLTKAIREGDLTEYDVALESVRDLTSELAIELKKLNQNADNGRPDPSNKYYTTEDAKRDPDQFLSNIRGEMPAEHDIPFGNHPERPKLKSFKWFQSFTPEDIQLPSGSKSGSQNAFFEEIIQLIMRATNLPDKLSESAIEDLLKTRWPTVVSNLKQAILDGFLLEYSPPTKPGRGMANIPLGQIDMAVYTAPFEAIPGALFECYVVMKDLSPSQPATKKLVIRFPKFMRDKASGMTVGLNSSPVRRKSTSIPKREEKLQEKKSSLVTKLSQQGLLEKRAGIDFSASKKLSEDFWLKFVQMSQRLGAKPEDLAKVINSESGFDPGATNVQEGQIVAKGLNQLIEKTAKILGMSDIEWSDYQHSSAENQLPYVEKYFHNVGKATGQDGRWPSVIQLYVANFAPKYVKSNMDSNTVLYSQEDGKNYTQNKGLDKEGKGHITVGDLIKVVPNKLPDHIAQAIENAKQKLTDNPQSNSPGNDNVEGLMDALVASGPIEMLVKESLLPKSSVLITLSTLAAPLETRKKFAKSVSCVVKDIIGGETSIHSDGSKIELQCSATGSQYAVATAVNALCSCVSEAICIRLREPFVRFAVVPSLTSKFEVLK